MAGLKCPLCGRPLEGFKEREYQTYHFGALSPMPAGTKWEKQKPGRAPTLQSDVATPGLQAAITSVIVGVAGGALAVACDWYKPLAIGLVTAGVGGSIAWFLLLLDSRHLLWEWETISGKDLDGDGAVGEPDDEAEPPNIRIEIEERRRQGLSLRFVDLPCTEEQLTALALGIMNGKSWAETAWTGRGKLFSRRTFADVREGLITNGLAQWVNPKAHAQGLEMTHAGRAMFKRIIEASSPTPERARTQAG